MLQSKELTNLQLRVARNVLNIGVRDVASLLFVNKSTVNKAELGKTKYFFHKYSPKLIAFFSEKNIYFPTEFSVRYEYKCTTKQELQNVITRFHLIAARSLLRISQKKLANTLKINANYISRSEVLKNSDLILVNKKEKLSELIGFFHSKNILFPDPGYVFFKNYVDNS